ASRAFVAARDRCAAAARLASARATTKAEYTVHPYPITPWHDDYVHHGDLVEAAKARVTAGVAAGPALRIRPGGGLAALPASPLWRAAGGAWDATLEEIPLARLLRGAGPRLTGGAGPPGPH